MLTDFKISFIKYSLFCAPKKTKGVLLLVDRNLDLHMDESGSDSNGRFCYALITLNSVKYWLVSIYAPNIFEL